MVVYIIDHLGLAEAYKANTGPIASLKCRPKNWRSLIRRCREDAERERAEAAAHARVFDIDPLVVTEEFAKWRRLRTYPRTSSKR